MKTSVYYNFRVLHYPFFWMEVHIKLVLKKVSLNIMLNLFCECCIQIHTFISYTCNSKTRSKKKINKTENDCLWNFSVCLLAGPVCLFFFVLWRFFIHISVLIHEDDHEQRWWIKKRRRRCCCRMMWAYSHEHSNVIL